MRVFMIGATGLLGSAGADELIKRGHSVSSISLPGVPMGAAINQAIDLSFGNYMDMSDDDLRDHLSGQDVFVFAAGVDERIEFPKPCYDAFAKYNIVPLQRILTIAKECGVSHAIVLGSYFSYFAKAWPEMHLTEHHPYIRSRIDQENMALDFADDAMRVSILELPYIFGTQPGRKPVWTVLVEPILAMKNKTLWPHGGTTMLTVRQVGQVIAGAVEHGVSAACPIGMYNKTWDELLAVVHKAIGQPERKITHVPKFLYKVNAKKMRRDMIAKNIEPGLDPVAYTDLMYRELFYDDAATRELGATDDDIDAAIIESCQQSLKALRSNKSFVDMRGE